jgi:hypothetical protein
MVSVRALHMKNSEGLNDSDIDHIERLVFPQLAMVHMNHVSSSWMC